MENNTLSLSLVNKIYRGDVVELRFKKPIGFHFSPGQCVEIYHPDGDCRVYSIASGVQKDSLTFMVKKLPLGKVSTWLYEELKENDIIRVGAEPYGFFSPGDTANSCVFIATGTGIAPFISYLESYMGDNNLNVEQILYGVRYNKEIVPVPFQNVTYCVSQDTSESSKVYKGRVTKYLEEHKDEIDIDAVYYVCGLDDALRDVSEILVDAGVPVENIIHEVFYFKTH